MQPTDLRLMPDYVIPALSRAAADSDEMVRCTLALTPALHLTTHHSTFTLTLSGP